jgi:hypothetical protein
VIKRRLNAVIRGSLTQFANAGQEAACWSTQNGRIQDIMGISELLDGTGDQASTTALLQNALLHKVTLLEYKNEFPVSLGVHVSCVPNKECTRTGHSYAFSTLPEHTNSTPLAIFENETSTHESMAWRQQYPEYTSNNLETHGVLNVSNESFVFVSKAHPVIDLLRLNKEVLNADIDQQTLIDDQWYKVTKQVMSTCCNKLKSQVLNRVGTVDLNALQLQVQRLDGMQWIEMSENDELFSKMPSHLMMDMNQSEVPTNAADIEAFNATQKKNQLEFTNECNAVLKRPYAFHARLEVEFEIMPTIVNGAA